MIFRGGLSRYQYQYRLSQTIKNPTFAMDDTTPVIKIVYLSLSGIMEKRNE